MDAIDETKISRASNEQRQDIIALLESEKLPVEDLPVSLDDFFVAIKNHKVIGAIGLEQYDHYGLLRSMVVNKAHRSKSIAALLLQQLEQYAVIAGIDCIFLLTETAPHYFERKGYKSISRAEVPVMVQASSEFSHVCPASAIVMKKSFSKNENS